MNFDLSEQCEALIEDDEFGLFIYIYIYILSYIYINERCPLFELLLAGCDIMPCVLLLLVFD